MPRAVAEVAVVIGKQGIGGASKFMTGSIRCLYQNEVNPLGSFQRQHSCERSGERLVVRLCHHAKKINLP